MKKLNMQTKDLSNKNFEKLKALFPNAITETIDEEGKLVRAIDKDILEQEISAEVVEGREERYQFTWPDKRQTIANANAPISKTLRPCREESVNFDETENLYIEGDNLEALKLLQETYLGKIKMIYIDPPYNTGSDFVYNDNFSMDRDEYLEDSGQFDEYGNRLEKNLESNGRFHTDWLNMMYPRLRLARNLLTDDGAILISIGDNEQANLKKICDEVFGESNFIANVVWANREGGGSSDSKHFRIKHEYCLVYAKNKVFLEINGLDVKDSDRYRLSDQHEEERGRHQLIKLDSASLGYVASLDYGITAPDGSTIFPNKGEAKISRWRWSKKKFKWGLENDYVVIKKDRNGDWAVYTKQYLNADNEGNIIRRTLQPTGIVEKYSTTQSNKELRNMFSNKSIFDYSKPVEYIKYLISLISKKDSIVLDFFSGSGTTAHATMQLNAEDGGKRKFIMVQLPEKVEEKAIAYKEGYMNICDIGKERIRRAGKEIFKANQDKKGIESLDTGFRVLKTDSSNMKDVYYAPAQTEQSLLDMLSDNIKEDRTPEDLLFQVMLDLGISLSSNIKREIIDNKEVFILEDEFLIACFDKNITEDTVKEIASQEPCYAVFRDSSIANDSVATNFEQIFENMSPKTVRKVV